MRVDMTRIVLLLVCGWVALSRAAAGAADAPGWILYGPPEIKWRQAQNLPAGAMIAVLEGDPDKQGLFTMRLKMPDGYRVPPHWHSQQERVTVLSGTLNLGSGDVFDPSATKPLPPGTFSSMPAGM